MSSPNDTSDSKQDIISLIGSDKVKHSILREDAMLSSTLKSIASGNFADSKDSIELPSMSGPVIEKVIEYMNFKGKLLREGREGDNTEVTAEKFENFNIPTELSLDVLLAADYLNI
ncbi:similar to Saccharomyces cerevisiae YPL046C ELC1 Elongin C, conserved among eukaryotes [Maudiozyma barnettii]|uniref:Elongin-C n=1 Tax=Maudiozyma barnettii TaxID=61262 RepID=A0A8H2VJB8_9SACH|nr:elongin C [Kazachstania barnettii]CAB4256625.1 similar to Saccharomyces cerevisiae YPL046C ELC1 Elongin C, conserved among eukaryotes [Kazachstania barnettii]CAD1785228.1 similar to Saccharomyces cerevisiae YPL046C ELC1 Elongin C, conserved among eukaryotes [Kazachstania barnettii]